MYLGVSGAVPALGLVTLAARQTLAQTASSLRQPIGLDFSQRTYGPDGPWQAVTVDVGSSVDLYPGVCGYTIVLDSQRAAQNAQASGTFNAQQDGGSRNGPSTLSQTDGAGWSVDGQFYANNMTVRNGVSQASGITLFSGNPTSRNSTRQLPVGFLDVGFPQSNFTVDGCSRSAGFNCVSSTSPPTYYYNNGMVSSSSFGMTLGSAAMNIPGAFHYGGYDVSKIVGPVGVVPLARPPGNGQLTSIGANGQPQTRWHDFFQTTLTQVDVRTVSGGSPFTAGAFDGVLNGSLPIQFDPSSPYIYLPRATCDSLTAHLPVTFNATLNLYLWNTSAPTYSDIIRSPTVLSLNLGSDPSLGAPASVNINIPFALLNLTLTPPLVQTATPYLPLQPIPSNQISVLGRAALQASYLGANWRPDTTDGVFFFGQAPGPAAQAAQPTGIAAPASSFAGGAQSFADSWAAHWSPLPNTSSASGLSAGAAAGVGVGVALGVLGLAAGAGAWFLLRRRRRATAAGAAMAAPVEKAERAGGSSSPGGPPAYRESAVAAPAAELHGLQVQEMGDGARTRAEADSSAKAVLVEAPGSTGAVEADAGGDGKAGDGLGRRGQGAVAELP